MKNKILTFFLIVGMISSQAQTTSAGNEATASIMRSNGKIYVVVAVVLTILIGLIAYLIRIDRKISRLEKE